MINKLLLPKVGKLGAFYYCYQLFVVQRKPIRSSLKLGSILKYHLICILQGIVISFVSLVCISIHLWGVGFDYFDGTEQKKKREKTFKIHR